MRRQWRRATVRARLILMALATTLAALLLTSAAMVVYELNTFQQGWIDDVTTQADIVAMVSAPALSFNDVAAARQNLALLQLRPQILAGAIYGADGRLFASYAQSAQAPALPASPGNIGYRIEGDRLLVARAISDHGETVGAVYLVARYPLMERLQSYGLILGAVMLCSLAAAALVATRLQRGITEPLAAVTGVARGVMQQRDFSLRVPASGHGEIGTLVAAFNAMLGEVERSASELQEANLTLQHEMAERKGAERALLLADRRKDEFLATLAHELRNPLAPIRTGLDILRINPNDAVAGQRARAIMERQLKQMVRLVDDLLDVSRINTGKLAIKREPVEFATVLNDALESVRPLIEAQDHALQVTPPPPGLMVEGDPTRLAQILANLLNNAAKYTNRGGLIELVADMRGARVQVRVRDNGIGIAPEMLGQIFGMFVQADSSLERSNAGLGVGLSLARHLAALHGGTIEAYSDGVGQGSEFVLTLPLLSLGGPLAAEADTARPAGRGHRILLADDNIDFVNSIGALLGSQGHTVSIAYDGAEALAQAASFFPDYCFLDIGLPRLNGYDLARGIRRLPGLERAVLVAVTGWGQQKDRELAAEAGFAVHLVKPVSFEQIDAILRG
ncbi:ATP-binding protein [Oxalobacteraceae bacterium A2-2]